MREIRVMQKPDNDSLTHAPVHRVLDAIHVVQVAECEDAGGVDAGNRRPQRRCSRRQDQFVVALFILVARSKVAHARFFRGTVDRLHRRAGANVQLESGPQTLGSDHEKLVPLGDLTADERAARVPAPVGDPRADVGDPLGYDLPGGDVVEQEQRFGTAHDEVVDDHGHQVDPDRVVDVELLHALFVGQRLKVKREQLVGRGLRLSFQHFAAL